MRSQILHAKVPVFSTRVPFNLNESLPRRVVFVSTPPITLLNSLEIRDLFHYLLPHSKKGGQSETLLNTCVAQSNSADLLLFNNASDWLSGDLDNKSQ